MANPFKKVRKVVSRAAKDTSKAASKAVEDTSKATSKAADYTVSELSRIVKLQKIIVNQIAEEVKRSAIYNWLLEYAADQFMDPPVIIKAKEDYQGQPANGEPRQKRPA